MLCAQVAGGTPFEQWDNMPLLAKAQIFIAVGMLESYGEGAGNPAGYVPYRVEIAPDNSSRHCSAMTRPCWLEAPRH